MTAGDRAADIVQRKEMELVRKVVPDAIKKLLAILKELSTWEDEELSKADRVGCAEKAYAEATGGGADPKVGGIDPKGPGIDPKGPASEMQKERLDDLVEKGKMGPYSPDLTFDEAWQHLRKAYGPRLANTYSGISNTAVRDAKAAAAAAKAHEFDLSKVDAGDLAELKAKTLQACGIAYERELVDGTWRFKLDADNAAKLEDFKAAGQYDKVERQLVERVQRDGIEKTLYGKPDDTKTVKLSTARGKRAEELKKEEKRGVKKPDFSHKDRRRGMEQKIKEDIKRGKQQSAALAPDARTPDKKPSYGSRTA